MRSSTRKNSLARLFFIFAGLMAFSCAAMAQSMAPSVKLPTGFVTAEPYAQVRAMQRGVNVLGYDKAFWADFSKGRFKPGYFKKIHDAGFQTVRVNLQAFQYMSADNKLPESWWRAMDWIVADATANHLQVIIDEHDFESCAKDLGACEARVLDFWRQVAPRYKDAPNSVTYEILNEPNGKITAGEWNKLLVEGLKIIRETNPTRNVVIGPAMWNSKDALKDLVLPADDAHIIVTFHYYNPFPFTHQGAYWAGDAIRSGHDIHWGTEMEKLAVEREFDGVAQWSAEHHRPILLGEFGAYDKAPHEDRIKWDGFIRQTAETRGFAWAYWQFDSDFVVYDVEHEKWNTPILKAIIP